MRQQPTLTPRVLFSFFIILLSLTTGRAQSSINFGRDTLSEADVIGARNLYIDNLRGNNKKATERINLPVNKLKEIIDACAANNITDISFMVITLRQNDIAHFRHHNPGVSDEQLRGSQQLVLKVPRRIFQGAQGSKINLSNNPVMLSLLSAGLVVLDLPFSESDLYLGFGSICPPPTSCD